MTDWPEHGFLSLCLQQVWISPITLDDNYGVFSKDSETCLPMDMEETHEVGVAKYDFLALKTVKLIQDTCNYIGIPHSSTHAVDWNDKEVWKDICGNLPV